MGTITNVAIATVAATWLAFVSMAVAAAPPRLAVLGSVAIGAVFGFFYLVDSADPAA